MNPVLRGVLQQHGHEWLTNYSNVRHYSEDQDGNPNGFYDCGVAFAALAVLFDFHHLVDWPTVLAASGISADSYKFNPQTKEITVQPNVLPFGNPYVFTLSPPGPVSRNEEDRGVSGTASHLVETFGSDRLPLEPGRIHFCWMETLKSDGDYGQQQNHYFVIIDNRSSAILIQAFGGVRGFTIKNLPINYSNILDRILDLDHQAYKELFEVPNRFSHLLEFDSAQFKSISIQYWQPAPQRLAVVENSA